MYFFKYDKNRVFGGYKNLNSYEAGNSILTDLDGNFYVLFKSLLEIFNNEMNSNDIVLSPWGRNNFFSMDKKGTIYVGGYQVLYSIEKP